MPAPEEVELLGPFPSPFALVPSALARRAAEKLQADLSGGLFSAYEADFWAKGRGKMFGVLVVADPQGRVGFVAAVSGMLGAEWQVEGLVPPAFDLAAHDASWPAGQIQVDSLQAERLSLRDSAASRDLHDRAQAQAKEHLQERAALKARHQGRRMERAELRAAQPGPAQHTHHKLAATPDALEEQSRSDKRERKEMRARLGAEAAAMASELAQLAAELSRRRAETVALCNQLLADVRSRYRICNAAGEHRSLDELFAPQQAPGGTGDCAGPKLLCYAHRQGLRPLAMAEFWWGASPAGGGRHSGQYYPACRGKCAPLLSFMLEGIEVAPAPAFATLAHREQEPLAIFEDDYIIVVNKPEGMLSVPGRSAELADSALMRMQARSDAPGLPLAVHRLDLDTSGLLLFAKSPDVHRALQALFAERKVEKHYLAWLDGHVQGQGSIDLPLRVDLDDRPRQIVDHRYGKSARTDYQVLGHHGGATQVRLQPLTGRSHQLRVHCAHSRGLGRPIVGDRLYGKAGPRLLLHAEFLAFVHPMTGERVAFRCDAAEPFRPRTP